MEGNGSVSITGSVNLNETRAAFDAVILQPIFSTPQLGGQISLDITAASFKGLSEWPSNLVGRAEARNLSSPLMGRGQSAEIGNIAIELNP